MSKRAQPLTYWHSEANLSDWDSQFSQSTQSDESESLVATQPVPDSSQPSSTSTLGKRASAEADVDLCTKRQKSSSSSISSLDSKTNIIASDPGIEAAFAAKNISRGVRFELARFISLGKIKYEQISADKLDQLQGPSGKAAERVVRVFSVSDVGVLPDEPDSQAYPSTQQQLERLAIAERTATFPWDELDLEERELAKSPYAGIGNNSKSEQPNWYGGKVEFRAKLQEVEGKRGEFKVVLEACTLGPSCRFGRRFGSWSFLKIKIPQKIHYSEGGERRQAFFQQPFVLWGSIYRACYSKGDNVFCYMTDEVFPSGPRVPDRLSFEEFISWHNPIGLNDKQLMTKWAARMALGFSTSVPGPRIAEENIIYIEDKVANPGTPHESDMTDGCGASSKAIHIDLKNRLDLSSVPTAFQFRLAGFKGMSLIKDDNPFHEDVGMKGYFRPSQTKIKHPPNMDPAHLTYDIIRVSHMRTPASISPEMIINLAENGVPAKVFADILRCNLEEIKQQFTTWDGPDAMLKLWGYVEKAEGVLSARRARAKVGEARARGFSTISPEDIGLDESADDGEGLDLLTDAAPKSTAWWTDYVSGCPSSMGETIMALLGSGFEPATLPFLKDKLHKVAQSVVKRKTKNFRFDVEQSISAFVVPDPFGVLGPDQIQVRSSSKNLKLSDGLSTDTLHGPVVMGRNPCKVPSDMRKVQAVTHPKLSQYTDVIICSTQGNRRLLDFLGGGDYDGDTAVVIWTDGIVKDFKTASDRFSQEPESVKRAFTRDEEKGTDFLKRLRGENEVARIHAMQKYLLGSLCGATNVGIYSSMHDRSVWVNGYDHELTVALAYKFCRVLDSSKTGYRILDAVFREDRKRHDGGDVPWKEYVKKADRAKNKPSSSVGPAINSTTLIRQPSKQFIMDHLILVSTEVGDNILGDFETKFNGTEAVPPDEALMRPWQEAAATAVTNKSLMICLSHISAHVQKAYRQSTGTLVRKGKGGSFSDLPIEERQDLLRADSKMFASMPDGWFEVGQNCYIDDSAIARLKASYLYVYDTEQRESKEFKWGRVPWNLAFRTLCQIKAESLGPSHTLTAHFHENMKVVTRK